MGRSDHHIVLPETARNSSHCSHCSSVIYLISQNTSLKVQISVKERFILSLIGRGFTKYLIKESVGFPKEYSRKVDRFLNFYELFSFFARQNGRPSSEDV